MTPSTDLLLRKVQFRGGLSSMATGSSSSSSTPGVENPRSLIANGLKRKSSFIQLFAMTGILFLSMRSLGQKYRLHDLSEDTYALREEHESLTEKMNNIKSSLLEEASLDSTGVLASRLRILFGSDE